MSVLISILITFLVVILVLYLINMLPIEGRAKQIVRIIVIIIGILSLLKYLGVWLLSRFARMADVKQGGCVERHAKRDAGGVERAVA